MTDPGIETPRELSLAEVLAFLRRRRGTIVGGFFVGCLLAGALSLLLTPAYVANARVRIVEQAAGPSLTSALANLPAGFGELIGGSPSVAAEMEVVRSRPIAASVVEEPDPGSIAPDAGLDLLDRVEDLDRTQLWRQVKRKLLGQEEAQGSLSVDVLRWDYPPNDGAELRIRFESSDVVEVWLDRWFGSEPRRFELEPDVPIDTGEAELVLRPEGDLIGRNFRVARLERQKTLDNFLSELNVRETQRGSSVLMISYPDTDARRSADIVNAVVRSYLAHNRERQIEQAGRSVAFLEAELERVRTELRMSEEHLQEFGERVGDIALPETAVTLIQELVEVDVEKAKLEMGARSKEVLLEGIRSGQFSELALAALEASFTDFEPEVPLASLIAQRAALLAEFTEEWPAVKQIEAEIDDRTAAIESLLSQQIVHEEGLASDLGSITERYAEKLEGLPEAQIELLRHQRRVETFSRILTLLVAQIQDAKVSEASAVPSAEVIEWAVAPRLRKKPSIRLNLAIGAFLGLLFGLGVGLWRELDRPLTLEAQAEAALGAPVLHALPLGSRERRKPLVVRDLPDGAGAEAFRALRSAFLHSVSGATRRAVVVCGVQAGDGASRTAANLAIALARSGRRVLLVDADLQEGALAAWFGVEEGGGFAGVARGELPWSEAVVPSGIEHLDLIPAGRTGSADTDVIATEGALAWLDEALAGHDVVLFDAPAVLRRADAVALAPIVGSVMFVCRAGVVPEAVAREAAVRVHRAGAETLGVVLNGARGRAAGLV